MYHFQIKNHLMLSMLKKKASNIINSINFFGLPTTSRLHLDWRTRQLTDSHGLMWQAGAQGIPAQGVSMILYICLVISSHFSHRAFTKPTDALPARNTFKRDQKQAWRLRQRQEGSFYPVFLQVPSVLTTWHSSSQHPHTALSLSENLHVVITYLLKIFMLYQM